MRLKAYILGIAAVSAFAADAAAYTLEFTNGRMPADVTVDNLNGAVPSNTGYRRGWTNRGWTIGQFGDKGYVAICPTYFKDDNTCESSITLPEQSVADTDMVRWEARAVYAPFEETYRIEARENGSETWNLIGEYTAGASWETHVMPLAGYAGKNVSIRIVCTSRNGYMLALAGMFVGTPDDIRLVADNNTRRYFGSEVAESGLADVEVNVFNSGITLESGSIVCLSDGTETSRIDITEPWPTGESRRFHLAGEARMNVTTGYSVVYRPAEGEDVPLAAGKFFTSHFVRNILVDKATGMWCTNCTAGVIEMENLEREFGPNLIGVETHTAGSSMDVLQNPQYYSQIQNYAVPMFMIDRIRASRDDNTGKFGPYYDREVNFRVALRSINVGSDNSLAVTAEVESASDIDNSNGRYRIGYVLTADFHEEDSKIYFQQNGCSLPRHRQFYYLPSRIMSNLIWFHNVSLTSTDAFTGIEGSIPSTLNTGSSYPYSWNIPCPPLLDDVNKARVNIFVLDTQTGQIENACAARPGDLSEVPEIPVTDSAAPEGIYTIQGFRLDCRTDELPTGLYIINGKKIMIKH